MLNEHFDGFLVFPYFFFHLTPLKMWLISQSWFKKCVELNSLRTALYPLHIAIPLLSLSGSMWDSHSRSRSGLNPSQWSGKLSATQIKALWTLERSLHFQEDCSLNALPVFYTQLQGHTLSSRQRETSPYTGTQRGAKRQKQGLCVCEITNSQVTVNQGSIETRSFSTMLLLTSEATRYIHLILMGLEIQVKR